MKSNLSERDSETGRVSGGSSTLHMPIRLDLAARLLCAMMPKAMEDIKTEQGLANLITTSLNLADALLSVHNKTCEDA